MCKYLQNFHSGEQMLKILSMKSLSTIAIVTLGLNLAHFLIVKHSKFMLFEIVLIYINSPVVKCIEQVQPFLNAMNLTWRIDYTHMPYVHSHPLYAK